MNSNIKHNIQWKVVDKVYNNVNLAMCKLSFTEKLWRTNHINDNNILNKN